ncbi:colicin E3/pyocin S6 family cytotoxin [uncultured Enterococcus sp.]|uniref:colicin E3/pyocin S6 family cytotoxin n=1 Tax=uncultured Enterococcus sp. TaxID=167972 RepID=UPI002AA899CC|nr:colicin E3/pyocin S6 family cytotoxin [uncultured Enterococcus sp.]
MEKLENVKGKDRKFSGKGNKKKYYEWDFTHNDIEVYDKTGRHLGSMDPVTGEMYKPPVPGRTIVI